jgi:hypothetical protein
MTTTVAEGYPRLTRQQVRTSDLVEWHTSTDPHIVSMLSSIPDYVAIRRAIVTLSEYKVVQRPIISAVDVLYEALVEDLLAGKEPPTDLLERLPDLGAVPVYEGRDYQLGIAIVANRADALLNRVEGEAARRAQDTLMAQLDGVLKSNRARIFGAISQQLSELVDRARKVLSDRGVVADAEDAIDQDRVEEYQASQRLCADYAELRRLQMYWALDDADMPRLPRAGTGDLFAAFVANPLQAVPDLSRLITGDPYQDPDDEKAFRQRGVGRTSWPEWSEPAALWWFASHRNAKPWAPTGTQFKQLVMDLGSAHHAHQKGARRAVPEGTTQ